MAQEVLPFGILFGTMLAFWRLTRSNELVVARAAGVSVWQFLMPAVLVALLVGVVAVTVFNPIASSMEARFEKLDNRILRQTADPMTLSQRGLCGSIRRLIYLAGSAHRLHGGIRFRRGNGSSLLRLSGCAALFRSRRH